MCKSEELGEVEIELVEDTCEDEESEDGGYETLEYVVFWTHE